MEELAEAVTMDRYSCPFGVVLHDRLDITVQRSRSIALALLIAHGATLAIVWHLDLPIMWHLALKLVLLGSLVVSLRSTGWLGGHAYPYRLRLAAAAKPDQADRIELVSGRGRIVAATLLEGSLVMPWLVILRARLDGSRWWTPALSCLLPADSLPLDDHRRLRVRLRWGRARPV
jgi:toxin CptA